MKITLSPMKRTAWLGLLLLPLLVLTACSGAAGATSAGAAADAAATAAAAMAAPLGTPAAPGAQSASQGLRLALGLLKLQSAGYPLTAEQATALLPLWKALRSLGNSDTAAEAEITALYRQIEAALTPEQLAYIQGLDLSPQNLRTLMQELGLEMGNFGGAFGTPDPSLRATLQAARQSGQAPPGGFPGEGMGPGMGMGPGGGSPGGEAGLSPEVRQTAQAAGNTRRGARLGLPAALLEAVIKLLEGLAAG